MAITYHAGRRIQGTVADRTGSDGVSGGWKELGRTSVTSGDSIDVTSLADKRYLMVLGCGIGSGNVALISRFNSDTGNNYNNRYSSNGGADATSGANDRLFTNGSGSSPQEFSVFYVANKSDKEKLLVGNNVNNATAGAGTAPQRREYANKWANTSSVISSLNVFNSDTGDFTNGSEVVVLGYDPDDTHTDNFWEELADITLSSDASEISSGTITAKKYLWVQVYFHNASTSNDVLVRFNNDTGSNYSHRHAINYGSDTTQTSGTSIKLIDRNAAADVGRFANFFVINKSDQEKLLIAHGTEEETSGVSYAPTSNECVAKWANTSSQITEIDCFTESGNIRSGARLRVWGSN